MSERYYQDRPYIRSDVGELYENTKEKIVSHVNSSAFFTPESTIFLDTEASALLFVVGNALAQEKNRLDISEELLQYAKLCEVSLFNHGGTDVMERIEFYRKINSKKLKVKAVSYSGIPKDYLTNSVTSCVVALSEMLKNPGLIFQKDFGKYIVVDSFNYSQGFENNFTLPLIEIVLEYVRELTRLCGIYKNNLEQTNNTSVEISNNVDDKGGKTMKLALTAVCIVAAVALLVYLSSDIF